MNPAKKIIKILLGNLILALGVNCFVVPQGLIMGGATGIGIAVNHYTGLNLSYALWILNLILFLMGLFVMGKAFAMTIIISTLFYPLCIQVLEQFPVLQNLTDDKLLAAIYSGILVGLGIALVVWEGASTGGMDIPPLILQKKFGIPVAVSLYVADFSVLLLQALFSDSEEILYGILNVFLSSIVVNYVTVSGQKKVQLFIVSPKYEKIRETLLGEMDLGVTLVQIETGFYGKEQMAVLCVTERRRLYGVKQLIQQIDPDAFVNIQVISEVRGRGFTLERKYQNPEKLQKNT